MSNKNIIIRPTEIENSNRKKLCPQVIIICLSTANKFKKVFSLSTCYLLFQKPAQKSERHRPDIYLAPIRQLGEQGGVMTMSQIDLPR